MSNFNAIHIGDVKDGESVERIIGDRVGIGGIAISPDASTLAVAANGGTAVKSASVLQIWDLHTRSLLRSIPIGENRISAVLFDPARKYVYCECMGKGARIVGVNLDTGVVETVFGPDRHGNVSVDWEVGSVLLLAISPNGKRLVLGTWKCARIWNPQTAHEEFSCPLSTETLCDRAAVSPDGRQLATAGDEVEVWDFHSGKRIAKPAHGMRGVGDCLTFSPDGTLLVAGASVSADSPVSYIQVWRVADYSDVIVIPCETSSLTGMQFLHGTNRLLCGTSDGTISAWDLDKLQWRKR
jgi:WD40 repeat protein